MALPQYDPKATVGKTVRSVSTKQIKGPDGEYDVFVFTFTDGSTLEMITPMEYDFLYMV